MIQDSDLQQRASLDSSASQRDILWTRRRIARRMIMRQDNAGCANHDRALEYFAHADHGIVEASDSDRIDSKDLVLCVEEHAHHDLSICDCIALLEDRSDVCWTFNLSRR